MPARMVYLEISAPKIKGIRQMDVSTPRKVGKSSLHVTPLGFGGAQLGSPFVTNEESLETVACAWDNGVRLYDTAPFYGIGRSERRLGLALSGLAGAGSVPPRDEYRVNTKVGKTLVAEPVRDESNKTLTPRGKARTARDALSGFRLAFDYTYNGILRQHEDSLQRMGLSSVDSLTIHDMDYGYHTKAQMEHHLKELSAEGGGGATALQELRDSGAISAIGCGCNLEAANAGSWEGSDHEDLVERIADTVDLDFLVIAGAYTLLETRACRRLLPMCEERNIGVVGASPYAGGWLVAPNEPGTTYMYAPPPDEIVERAQRMNDICERHEVPLAAAALQFPLAHPRVASVIPGPKTPQEAAGNYRHINTPIPEDVWRSFKEEGLLDPAVPTPS
ncbi:MAG: aldo/keto reductase [Candidatus Hydrogenedentes bacterium]|nr:aldo/keto reductase [Candidatus Hydrogenedentota bacterium]